MKRFVTSNAFLYTAGLVFVLVVWLMISLSLGQGNLIFPSPADTFAYTFKLLSSSYIYECLGMTLLRTLEGFLIAFALAFLLGTFAGEVTPMQRFFKPFILVLKSMPTAALVFLFLVLSGTKRAPIWIVSLLAFPILYEAFVSGIVAVPLQLRWAAKIDQASPISTALRVKLPVALPYVILGVLNSFALSFKTEIMAEIVAGHTSPGLGGAIRVYRNSDPADLTPVFAISLIAIVFVLIVDLLVFLVSRLSSKTSKES